MTDRWPTLKRLFQGDRGALSAEQRRALHDAPDLAAAWQTPEVRVASPGEVAAMGRAEGRAPRPTAGGGERWIVTSADRRFWHFLTCFVASLRDVARFDGCIAVIDYGLTGEQRQRLEREAIVILSPLHGHALVIDRYFTLAARFRDHANDLILYFDADIWFADSIDELFANHELRSGKLGAAKDVRKCDYYDTCTNPEHHRTMNSALTEVVNDFGQTLQAGFIAGSTSAWARYTTLLHALLTEGFAKDTWGSDALALNLYAKLYADYFLLLPITYNAPLLWGVVREGARFYATKFDTDASHRPDVGRIPVKAIHMTGAVRHRTELGLDFGAVYPEILERWSGRLGTWMRHTDERPRA